VTRIYSLSEIEAVLPDIDIIREVGEGFVAYSEGKVDVPPVGELLFPENAGEMHIKYGAIRGDDVFVVKVATGFFQNPKIGLPPFGGCMLVFSQKTGMVESVLLEDGELTNHRTAAAGAVCAKYLAPAGLEHIGIVGSGVQARMQADYLRRVTDCRRLYLWARNADSADKAAKDITAMGFEVVIAQALDQLCKHAGLIVTTTASQRPLLTAEMIRPGTHITAMGSDTPEKNEVAPDVLAMADILISDSLSQSHSRGEIFQARRARSISDDKPVELGSIIADRTKGRSSADQITFVDLTGVGVQDIAIAKAVVNELR